MAEDNGTARFDAPAHMRKIRTRQGMQDYLDVKWRVAWLRAEHPDAQIITDQVEADADHARFRCHITIPAHHDQEHGIITCAAIATGHGSETAQDFPDFYEKAETKAVGRACAMLGYGTDMAADLDDGTPMDGAGAAKGEGDRQMDERQRQQVDAQHQRNQPPAQAAPKPPPPPAKSNVHQHAQIFALAEAGYPLGPKLAALQVAKVEDLTVEQAKEIIVTARSTVRNPHAAQPAEPAPAPAADQPPAASTAPNTRTGPSKPTDRPTVPQMENLQATALDRGTTIPADYTWRQIADLVASLEAGKPDQVWQGAITPRAVYERLEGLAVAQHG